MKTSEVISALTQVVRVLESEVEVIDGFHNYAQKFGGSPGGNVFGFVLEDALRLRGITLEEFNAEVAVR
jgi:hypothetical protein